VVVTVKVSNSERTLKEKHLFVGADIKASHLDPTLSKLVQDAIKTFNGETEDVQVIISMTW
jgi:hypothetical protein